MSTNVCLHCGKITTNPKYCSKSCSAKETNKIPKRVLKRKCAHCDNIVRNYRSQLCEQHHQLSLKNKKEHIQNLTLADYYERESIKRLHQSSKYAHVRGLARSWNKDLLSKCCNNCGYCKHVELCHIKALSKFPPTAKLSEVNAQSNLIQLCPNCHWEFDNGFIDLAFPEQVKFT